MSELRFVLRNDHHAPISIQIEPEAHDVTLEFGEEIEVFDTYRNHPLTLSHTQTDTGETLISIWPGDGEVRVEKGGVDVLTILPSVANS